MMYTRPTFATPLTSTDVQAVGKAAAPQTSPSVCEEGRPYFTDPLTGRRVCKCQLTQEAPHGHLSGIFKSLVTPSSAVPPGFDPAALYGSQLRGFPIRPSDRLQCLTSAGPLAFDSALMAHPYAAAAVLYPGFDMNGLSMRKAATRETTGPLKAWLLEHRKNPYPTKAEKIMLAIITKMTLTQVSTWFANARRRLKKESRLYSNSRENDDDPPERDDDDDNESGAMRGDCDSEEDINVDVSDISDNEDGAHTPASTTTTTITTTSTTTPSNKASPCTSASPATLPTYVVPTTPFPRPVFPRAIPVPVHLGVGYPAVGPMPVIGASNEILGAVSPGGSAVVTKPSTHSGDRLIHSTASSSASSGSSTAQAPRPKIWSITDLIHSQPSNSSATSSPAAAAAASNASATDTTPSPSALRDRDTSPPCVNNRVHEPLHHGQPFSLAMPEAEVRHNSRHASAFLLPIRYPSLMTLSTGLRPQISPHVVNRMTLKDGVSAECSLGAAVAPSGENTHDDSSPQTEALDLQTKKEDKENKSKT